ncbi:LTA synthase family protein [Thermophagus xiamenensis]|uniref:Phosphoglycerol transferase MdoB n=1 Tax=Thermophagus xiamenensis TaxID=385682 RepID=A0A1I1ZAM7_9BACT|nr:alkaline phosphatase family protein [Thermophagus xiamenensis]SFE28811.1 Phosphoglycerol transferase MdoB [Thermophagus xiamenensis]
MKRFIYSFLRAYLFWLVFFAFFRTLFIIVNQSFIEDTPITVLLASYWPGLRMDMSFAGYLMLLVIVFQLFLLPLKKDFCYRCFKWVYYILIPIFVGLLLGDINLFRYWAGHLNKEAISFLKTPDIIFDSIHLGEAILFFVLCVVFSWLWIFLFNKVVIKTAFQSKFNQKQIAVNWLYTLLLGAFMIVPIRGSFSVAPINTGVAYFSGYLFANNAAVNPLWNLAYSMKRNAINDGGYSFMDDQKAQERFNNLMHQSGKFPKILNTDKPNIVVILLESFSAQAIKKLGGQNVTPNLNTLMKEGIFFSNLYSASFRSDYGIVGVLTGYPGIPGYSVMQYPEKSRHLNFIPQKLKKAGYKDLNFLYGGDMTFKNMKSLIVLAGFDSITSIEDFPAKYRGKKWGVHDQYTFEKLLNLLENSNNPSFSFFFTLSSHEPFDVPMERVINDDYLNSVYYTDHCLGIFFDQVKKRGLWDNTLFILVADHGVVGPEKLGYTNARRYHIPMLWTGGAVAVKDTVIETVASQVDLAATLLNQLNIDASDFKFSKNILDESVNGFAFVHYPDGFGFIDSNVFQMYNKNNFSVQVMSGAKTKEDSLKAKVWMQIIAKDFKERLSNEWK